MTKKPSRSRFKRKSPRGARAARTTRARGKRAVAAKAASASAREPMDDFIEAAARALGLPAEPEWRPAIKANLQVTLRLGTLVAELALPDDAEPAPVFHA